jgi:hypothetical protein
MPRPLAVFCDVGAASSSNTNGNSSLSYAPSTNAGANDLEGLTPSCLSFCVSISVFSVVYFSKDVANWVCGAANMIKNWGGHRVQRTQFFVDY